MALTKLGGGYDDVQNTEPSNPSIGDTWLDTGQNPPVSRVYADVGEAPQWTQIDSDAYSQRIFDAIERRVTQRWTTTAEFDDWSWNPKLSDFDPVNDAAATSEYVINSPGTNSFDIQEGDYWGLSVDAGGTDSYGEIAVYTDDTVDLTVVDEVSITWEASGTNANTYSAFVVNDTTPDSYGSYQDLSSSDYVEESGSFDQTTSTIDTSGMSGIKHISVHTRAEDTDFGGDMTTTVDSIDTPDTTADLQVSDDEIKYNAGTDPISATSPTISPDALYRWDITTFTQVLDTATVSINVEDEIGNELLTNVKDGEDISDISRSKSLRLRVDFDRSETSENPRLEQSSIGWLE